MQSFSLQTLVESVWYSQSLLKWFLWPLSLPLLFLVNLKRFLYQKNILKSNQFSKPVLVVGNITLGGTGKTPFINQLIKLLNENGIKVGLVSRGYGAQVKTYPHQIGVNDTAVEVGDEAYMQFLSFNNHLPIVIDPNRSRGVNFLIKNNDIDLVISDDGLQHYKMSRDLEIVLFDGERQFGNQLILPFGPLREPLTRLKTVGHVVQNGMQINPFSQLKIKVSAVSFIHLKSNKEIPLTEFNNKKVNAVAGIGNPKRFYNSLESLCEIETTQSFADHHQFTANDLDELKHYNIVMTEKDAVKCVPFAKEHWYYLKVEMNFCENLIEELLKSIKPLISLNEIREKNG